MSRLKLVALQGDVSVKREPRKAQGKNLIVELGILKKQIYPPGGAIVTSHLGNKLDRIILLGKIVFWKFLTD